MIPCDSIIRRSFAKKIQFHRAEAIAAEYQLSTRSKYRIIIYEFILLKSIIYHSASPNDKKCLSLKSYDVRNS